ncbi:carbohydrate ABC transporter permease [Paenibacillus filicis]|uniref:Carbohydrate ABC transporter permease n=1 Tax=Paenibacillus filicis TaxID=669464 RepID=A0ABU9DTE5_9BACL
MMSSTARKQRKSDHVFHVVLEILMIALAALVAVPIYYLFVTTFKSPQEAAAHPLSIPTHFSFQQYVEAWNAMNYLNVLTNNLIITVTSVALVVIISAMAAFPLARRPHKLNKTIFFLILSGIMIPYQMAIIPLYRLIKAMHLIDSQVGVILIYSFVFMPMATFIFHGFIKTIPIELEEAARIDGCGVGKIFWRITFPLLRPATATIIILVSLNIWNDFVFPLLFLQSREKGTILLEVYRNVGQFSTDWTQMFPMLVLGILPMFIFYLLMQKHIIKGIASGSIKG